MQTARGGAGVGVEDEAFLVEGGVVDLDLQHEAVDLGLGEGVGAFLLDGVLGGEDEEGVGEGVGFLADGDLALLHGFEERGLDLRGGAVDFVGEDDVGEDGAFAGGEVAGLGVVDEGSDEVGGEEVGGELDAREVGAEGLGEGLDGQGLGQTGDAFEEQVAVGEEAHEEAFEEGALADDHGLHFGEQRGHEGGFAADEVVDGVDVGGGGHGRAPGVGFWAASGAALGLRMVT